MYAKFVRIIQGAKTIIMAGKGTGRSGGKDMDLNLRPEKECKFDAVSLGEVMLRLDPGEGRIRTARSFRAWEGGGEYNVVRGLRRCFGMKTAVITAFADNEVGMLMEDFILQGGVDTSLIKWMKTDGIGRICRNGINFTERGFGIRGLWDAPTVPIRLFPKLPPKILILIIFLGNWVPAGYIPGEFMRLFPNSPVKR